VYDKIKRNQKHNEEVLKLVKEKMFDTSTSNSVLNVIENEDDLMEHIQLSYSSLKPNVGKAYFKIWKGNNFSISSNENGNYQRNCSAEFYVDFIKNFSEEKFTKD
jgi:hypothetical protein